MFRLKASYFFHLTFSGSSTKKACKEGFPKWAMTDTQGGTSSKGVIREAMSSKGATCHNFESYTRYS